jgi:guanylate cyclase soluble subunit beta
MYCLGDSLAEFLINLNNLHMHLSMSLPNMVAPAFRCENITSTSLDLHYHSPRPALWPIVKGIVLACSEGMFHHPAEIELVLSREAGTSDHEVFRVTYPPQENMRNWNMAESGAATSLYGLNNTQFYRLFPFHILLDKRCHVLQCGHALQRLYPDTLKVGTHVGDTFRLRHPHIEYQYEAMVADTNTSYLLTAHSNGMELKGMIFATDACVVAGEAEQPGMLFLASPRVASLDDLQKFRLFLSDIPLHDMSRDYVLLAEQRSAEVDLKNLYEKNLADLNATMKALNTSNAALQAASERLAAEQARSDALLYQMLPRGVADKLRREETVDAVEYDDITILFSDIVGFSTIASRCSARAVCDMLNELYVRFDGLIESPAFANAGIYKVETIGDAYMCVCNLETPCADHADQLVAFASAMHAAAAEVTVLGAPLRIRVGIHSGPAVGGVVGRRKPAFCLFGTSVNTASRSAFLSPCLLAPCSAHGLTPCASSALQWSRTACLA